MVNIDRALVHPVLNADPSTILAQEGPGFPRHLLLLLFLVALMQLQRTGLGLRLNPHLKPARSGCLLEQSEPPQATCHNTICTFTVHRVQNVSFSFALTCPFLCASEAPKATIHSPSKDYQLLLKLFLYTPPIQAPCQKKVTAYKHLTLKPIRTHPPTVT
eukprot:1157668-Pelagomonas_calceolata.AAC.1